MRAIRPVSSLVLVTAITATVACALPTSPAMAASLAGKPCQKVGMTTGDGPGRTVVCTRMKKGPKKGKLF